MKLLLDCSTNIPIGAAIALGLSVGILIGVLISVAVFVLIQRRIWFESSIRKATGLSYAKYENEANSEDDADKKAIEDYLILVKQQNRRTPFIQNTDKTFQREEKQQERYQKSDRDTYVSIVEADQYSKKDKNSKLTDKQTKSNNRNTYLSPAETVQEDKKHNTICCSVIRAKRNKNRDTYLSPAEATQDGKKDNAFKEEGCGKNYRDTYLSIVEATQDGKKDNILMYTGEQADEYERSYRDTYLSLAEATQEDFSPSLADYYNFLSGNTVSHFDV